MPPNVLFWDDSSTTKSRFGQLQPDHKGCAEEDVETYIASDLRQANNTSSVKGDNDKAGRWQQWLVNKETLSTSNVDEDHLVIDAFASILILDDEVENAGWLHRFGGRLSLISKDLLAALRQRAPLQFAARVADFNDNLLYQMQTKRGFDHFDLGPNCNCGINDLEQFLNPNEYLGSFLSTESSWPQPPHVDYTWEILKEHEGDKSLMLGFFPLTKDGMFLQVWPTASCDADPAALVSGQIVYIPFGRILLLPASTIHGGGFRTTSLGDGAAYGNLRFHLYVASGGEGSTFLPLHQSNKYTEPLDKATELSRRYVDSHHMPMLMRHLFVTAND